jgi:hypothetical protein
MAEPTVTPLARTIELRVTGQPDVPNQYGSGHIRPTEITFRYQTGNIRAQVYGRWIREDGELTDAPITRDYTAYQGDMSDWPDWVAELAREHQHASTQPDADRTAGWLDAAAECNKAGGAYAERGAHDAACAAFALMEKFLMEAGKAEYVATPCSASDYCDDGGEPCSVHERLMGHAEGDHELCAPDCGEPWQRRLAAESPKS